MRMTISGERKRSEGCPFGTVRGSVGQTRLKNMGLNELDELKPTKITLAIMLLFVSASMVTASILLSNILTSPNITVTPGSDSFSVYSTNLATQPFNMTVGQSYAFHVVVNNTSQQTFNGVLVNVKVVADYGLSSGDVALNYSHTVPITWLPLEDVVISGNTISGHTEASLSWPPGYSADIDFLFTPKHTGIYHIEVWASQP